MAWGHGAQGDPAVQDPATPAVIEDAPATAVKDPDRVTALLAELSRGRLWLPLPDASPVTDGSAVMLPTVTYLGAEFVPAFTSAERLVSWPGRMAVPAPPQGEGERLSPGDGPFATMPHIVVPAAELARRMPPGVGIALNPGAEASVPNLSRRSRLPGRGRGGRGGHPGQGGPPSRRPGPAPQRGQDGPGRGPVGAAGVPGLAVCAWPGRGPGHLRHPRRPGQ